jgi:pteridine reductase
MNLKNKIILITGGAARVGKVIALKLAKRGAKVVVHYHRNKSVAEATINEIGLTGSSCFLVQGDISKKDDWIKIHNIILEKWNTIDVLINNAAIFYKTPLSSISELDWNQFLDINLKGTFWGCQIIGETMYHNKSGKIINIADVSAESIWPNYIPYCVSKMGVIALTKGLAKALAPYVTVNAVSPGTVLLADKYDEEEENELIKKTPLKRIGAPEDIANTITFLIEGGDFINGAVINVDGGRSLT